MIFTPQHALRAPALGEYILYIVLFYVFRKDKVNDEGSFILDI